MRNLIVAFLTVISVAGCGSSNNPKTQPDMAMKKPSPDMAQALLNCGDLIGCINPCTNQSCVTDCQAMASDTAVALNNALTTCIQNNCASVDGGNDGFVCCELMTQCDMSGTDFSSDLAGSGITCATTTCSGRGPCADALDACHADM